MIDEPIIILNYRMFLWYIYIDQIVLVNCLMCFDKKYITPSFFLSSPPRRIITLQIS